MGRSSTLGTWGALTVVFLLFFSSCRNYSVGGRQQKAFGRAWPLSASAGEASRAIEELVWLVGAFFAECFARGM